MLGSLLCFAWALEDTTYRRGTLDPAPKAYPSAPLHVCLAVGGGPQECLGSCREVDSGQEILGTVRHCIFAHYSTDDRQVPTVCQVRPLSLERCVVGPAPILPAVKGAPG